MRKPKQKKPFTPRVKSIIQGLQQTLEKSLNLFDEQKKMASDSASALFEFEPDMPLLHPSVNLAKIKERIKKILLDLPNVEDIGSLFIYMEDLCDLLELLPSPTLPQKEILTAAREQVLKTYKALYKEYKKDCPIIINASIEAHSMMIAKRNRKPEEHKQHLTAALALCKAHLSDSKHWMSIADEVGGELMILGNLKEAELLVNQIETVCQTPENAKALILSYRWRFGRLQKNNEQKDSLPLKNRILTALQNTAVHLQTYKHEHPPEEYKKLLANINNLSELEIPGFRFETAADDLFKLTLSLNFSDAFQRFILEKELLDAALGCCMEFPETTPRSWQITILNHIIFIYTPMLPSFRHASPKETEIFYEEFLAYVDLLYDACGCDNDPTERLLGIKKVCAAYWVVYCSYDAHSSFLERILLVAALAADVPHLINHPKHDENLREKISKIAQQAKIVQQSKEEKNSGRPESGQSAEAVGKNEGITSLVSELEEQKDEKGEASLPPLKARIEAAFEKAEKYFKNHYMAGYSAPEQEKDIKEISLNKLLSRGFFERDSVSYLEIAKRLFRTSYLLTRSFSPFFEFQLKKIFLDLCLECCTQLPKEDCLPLKIAALHHLMIIYKLLLASFYPGFPKEAEITRRELLPYAESLYEACQEDSDPLFRLECINETCVAYRHLYHFYEKNPEFLDKILALKSLMKFITFSNKDDLKKSQAFRNDIVAISEEAEAEAKASKKLPQEASAPQLATVYSEELEQSLRKQINEYTQSLSIQEADLVETRKQYRTLAQKTKKKRKKNEKDIRRAQSELKKEEIKLNANIETENERIKIISEKCNDEEKEKQILKKNLTLLEQDSAAEEEKSIAKIQMLKAERNKLLDELKKERGKTPIRDQQKAEIKKSRDRIKAAEGSAQEIKDSIDALQKKYEEETEEAKALQNSEQAALQRYQQYMLRMACCSRSQSPSSITQGPRFSYRMPNQSNMLSPSSFSNQS